MPYENDIESALNSQIDKQVSRVIATVADAAEDATEEEDETLAEEILAILLLLMLMRGQKNYNDGLTMALDAGLDISDTSKFGYDLTNEDRAYERSVVKSFNEDTATNIAALVAAGVAAGLTSSEIKRQLESFTSSQSKRVKRFAKNEAWRASERAGNRAMIQLNDELNKTQSAGTYKTWNVQPGACPICIDYSGVSVGIKDTFFGGLEGPPAHVTCRCKLTYSIVKGEPKSVLELHCSGCNRFLGTTAKDSVDEKLKCPISKCGVLEIPIVKSPVSASSQ